jgi:hypothetical protein
MHWATTCSCTVAMPPTHLLRQPTPAKHTSLRPISFQPPLAATHHSDRPATSPSLDRWRNQWLAWRTSWGSSQEVAVAPGGYCRPPAWTLLPPTTGELNVSRWGPRNNARLSMLHLCAARFMNEVTETPHSLSVTVFLGQALHGKGSPAALLTRESKAIGLQLDPMCARGYGTCLSARSVFCYWLAEHCCSLSVFPQRLTLWGMGWCTGGQLAGATGLCREGRA